MTKEEIQQLKLVIVATAHYYNRTLSDDVVKMLVQDLLDLQLSDVLNAYKTARRDPRRREMPLPSVIRSILQPEETPEQRATEIANRVWAAISKFGWSNPTEARLSLGETGWLVVQNYGGWVSICQQANSGTAATMLPQIRKTAEWVSAREVVESPQLDYQNEFLEKLYVLKALENPCSLNSNSLLKPLPKDDHGWENGEPIPQRKRESSKPESGN